MKIKLSSILLFSMLFSVCLNAQNNQITIDAVLNTETHEIKIGQQIIYHNKSNVALNKIAFHNWPNAYKDKKTPLAKRFVEKNSKIFHFTSEKNRGSTLIENISIANENAVFEITKANPDIIFVQLQNSLKPKDSVVIKLNYTVKIPKDRFTKYGVDSYEYNLRYWYIVPAIFNKNWKTYNNLDLDDLYMDFTNYNINFKVPENYLLNSDIIKSSSFDAGINTFELAGKNRFDIELNITQLNEFSQFNSKPVSIITNLNNTKLNQVVKTDILTRELLFIESYLGHFPHKNLLINKIDYDKNPVYGFNQLPAFLTPFSDNFEWDIKMFKVLTKKYIENLFLFDQRKDSWLADGLQTYLMIKYVEKFYPEMKALGNISKIWGIRSYNLAKIDFNDKYYFVHQFAARKNLDQPLTTPTDSLSNFNRKLANKYKAGIGLKFLENYLSEETLANAIKDYSKNYRLKKTTSSNILKHLKTSKDLNWFTNGYLTTNKKPDYTIKKVAKTKDSVKVTIQNKRAFTTPVQLYGIKDNEIKFKKWLTDIDSTKTISVPKSGFDKLSLNYESLLPEYNLRNNWKNLDRKLFARPFQFRIMKDIENPYYNQLFYTPVFGYNYYDGIILGLALSNKTLLNKSIHFKVTPSYSTKSNTFSGSYAFTYEHLPENGKVNRIAAGITGSHFEYAEDLPYNKVVPFAILQFRKKHFRDISSNAITTSYTFVDKKPGINETEDIETLKYGVFSIDYGYSKPTVLEDIRFSTGFQFSEKFSKVQLNAHYRILTNTNTQFDFRLFAGAFLRNNTTTDFFSFALDRPSDYLFRYDYFGRSETSGFFAQQIIINEGGFKSKLPVAHANKWLTSINTSIGIWRWIELYNDVALLKNKNHKPYFAYENGFRLNFVQDILEVYFPMYSNLGWEVTQPDYASRIRFVLVLKPKKIFNFLKRGFY